MSVHANLELQAPQAARPVLGVTASAFLATALFCWIAANWNGLERLQKLSIPLAALALCGGVALLAAARPGFTRFLVPALFGALASVGGGLAVLGQIYPSGADAWQLFALWAALGLPFCFAARHDALWSLWVIIFSTACALYMGQEQAYSAVSTALPVWAAAAAATFALAPAAPLRAWVGGSKWAFILAALFLTGLMTATALPAALERDSMETLVLVAVVALLSLPETAVFIACVLIALSAHRSFSRMVGLSSFVSGWSVGALVLSLPLTDAFLRAHLYGLSIPWLAFAAGGCAALFWRKAELRKPSFFLTAAVAIGLTFAAPRLGAAIAVFAGAVLTGRRIVAILAIVQAIAVLSLSYYSIDWTLIQKAQHFAAAGLVLALAAALARAADKQGGNAAGIAKPALALNALGLVLGFGLMTQATLSAENLLAEGRKIYLPLAPVDPRSLVQGDYMRLNFVTGDLRRMASARGAIQFVADVDSRSAASLKKIAGPSEPLEANQILINGRFKDRGYFIASDAWFFEEGQGKKFEAAKFGILRVGADGRALLEGLADADLQQIR